MAIKTEDVVNAYRFLLGREPESAIDLEKAANEFADRAHLRDSVMRSGEAKWLAYDATFEKRSEWVRVTTSFGRKLYLCLSDLAVSKHILLTGGWEPEVQLSIQSLLTPNSVFLDIGANIGWFTLFVADYFERANGTGVVISFEANPDLLPYLIGSISESCLGHRVFVKPYAVSDAPGVVQMQKTSEGNVGGLTISRINGTRGATRRNIVPTIRLDDALMDLERIDCIKMDIEGAEPLAIKGATDLLERHRPDMIVEVNKDALLGVSGFGVSEFYALLCELDYQAFDIRKRRVAPVSEEELVSIVDQTGYYDFLFRSKRRREP